MERRTKQTTIFFITLLLCISIVSPADFIFKQNSNARLELPVFENDVSKCTTCTCTLSINSPDGSLIVRDNSTGIDGHYATYDLTSIHTENLGLHTVDISCDNTADYGASTFEYEVTPTGDSSGSGWFLLIVIGLSFGIMILGFKLLDPSIVILGTFGLYFVSFYVLFYGIQGVKNTTTTWAVGLVLLGLAFYISTKSAYELITD